MDFDYIKYTETKGLRPLKIENKEKYLQDLINLEDSWTGRLDAQLSNTFIPEAVQLIINSITLFELGYFDASFYSLRQSLEVSTTMTYLIDNEEELRKEELKKWKAQSRFPMYSEMLRVLEKNQSAFSDIKKKMTTYFEELNLTKQKLNKYVHKQGFNTFYVTRNAASNKETNNNKLIQEFESHLKKCIGAIAVFRLSIDPFPILLNDENIYTRTGDLMTEAYPDSFIEDYIGTKNIIEYKKTDMYQNHYDSIIQEEPKNIHTLDLIKNQYVDKENIDKIFEQKHLLRFNELMAIFLFSFSEKIANIYCMGGMHRYFSSTKSNRKNYSYNSQDFDAFEQSTENNNLKYDEAFISTFKTRIDTYFIEHNSQFTTDEINNLESLNNFIEELLILKEQNI